MALIKYKPLNIQRAFHHSEKPKAYLSAGYGYGKTYSLCMKMFDLMDKNRGVEGGILCPTLKMFKRDVLPTIREICADNLILHQFNKSDFYFTFPQTNSTIYVFHSEDEGQSIRGPNLGFGLVNEVGLCSKAAFDAFLARIRVKDAKLRQLAMSGTPEGFNWCYEYFIENPRDDTDIFFGNSKDNIHIAEDYVKGLEESYDDLMRQQFVEGKFVNLTGRRAAWSFDRFKHVKPVKFDPSLAVWISMDFNVDAMAATFWHRYPIDSPYTLGAFGDIKLRSSNTEELANYIKEKFGTKVTIFPDPAGAARSTKSKMTDIQILMQAGFTDIRFKRSIKSVRECLLATNAQMSKDRIIIDPSAKNLIADLEQCVLKSNGSEIDKSDGNRSHWLDGYKDMIDLEFPIIHQKASEMRQL